MPYEIQRGNLLLVRQQITDALNDLEQKTSGGFASGVWRWTTGTSGDPGSGYVGGNNPAWASITQLRISKTKRDGADVGLFLDQLLVAGAQFLIQESDDPNNASVYIIAGAPTDNTTYYTVAVTYVDSTGVPPGNNDSTLLAIYATSDAGLWDSSGSDIYNTNAGNVGVGTTIPSKDLTVLGDLLVTTNNLFGPTEIAIGIDHASGGGDEFIFRNTGLNAKEIEAIGALRIFSTQGMVLQGGTSGAQGITIRDSSGTDRAQFTDDGKLIIGEAMLFPFAGSGAGLGQLTYQNENGSFATLMRVVPKSGQEGQFEVFATDVIADPTNWANFRIVSEPSAPFHLQSTSNGTEAVRDIIIETEGNNDQLVLDAGTGNVGIGVAAPLSELHVSGGSFAEFRHDSTGGAGSAGIRAICRTDGFYRWSLDASDGSAAGYQWNSYANSLLMVLTDGGNLALGPTTPGTRLDVGVAGAADTTAATLRNTGAGGVRLEFRDDNLNTNNGQWQVNAFTGADDNFFGITKQGSGVVELGLNAGGDLEWRAQRVPVDFGSLTSPPTAFGVGDTYFDSVLNCHRKWDGTNWRNFGLYSMMRRVSTSSSTAAPSLVIPWQLENDSAGSDITWSSSNNTRLTVNADGVYRVGASVTYTSADEREQASLEVLINGFTQGIFRSGGYIRNSGASWDFWCLELAPTPYTLSSGDYIEIRLNRHSGADTSYTTGATGTVTLRGSASEVWVERVD